MAERIIESFEVVKIEEKNSEGLLLPASKL